MRSTEKSKIGIIILAAGHGKRMCSDAPKVVTQLGGHSMIVHVLKSVNEASPYCAVGIVVGFEKECVIEEVNAHRSRWYPHLEISFVEQPKPQGTGDAVRCAVESKWGQKILSEQSHILVLPGDQPLMTADLMRQMMAPVARIVAIRMMTCISASPCGYGRIIRRGKKGQVLRVVEEEDANRRELEINEIATSVFLYRTPFLKAGLKKLSNKNAQKEYYLTDLVKQASRGGKKIDALQWTHPEDLMGVNNPWEWTQAAKILNQRCLKNWALKGVKFQDPDTTWIDEQVVLGECVLVGPGVALRGDTQVQCFSTLGAHVELENTKVGQGCEIKVGTVAYDSEIGEKVKLGPYAHLRPGSKIEDHSKIGNFVEIKKSTIGKHTSVAHLSYIGDAVIGDRVNIGCGFVTCNFDGRVVNGRRKHQTVIEDDVFMGSDCQAIAPVRIGKGSYVASGSTITHEVPPGDLAIARSRQVNKKGFAERLLKRSLKEAEGQERLAVTPKDGNDLCVE